MLIFPEEKQVSELYHLMTGSLLPRPIALVSTLSADNVRNLAPFSYFNAVSTNPLILMIAPVKQGNGKEKDTFHNLKSVGELTINLVNREMAEQMNLASAPFPPQTDEFVQTGLQGIKSERVQPERVAQSPVSYECVLHDILELGQDVGSGNLLLCKVVAVHIDDQLLDEKGRIDPFKADFVARLGGKYYSRILPESIFQLERPGKEPIIGFGQISDAVKNSGILSPAELTQLASFSAIPEDEEWGNYPEELQYFTSFEPQDKAYYLHKARHYLADGQTALAWLLVKQYG